MTEDLIKEVKHIQQCLINVDMEGEDWEEKMEAVHKLEDVATYLKDALGKGTWRKDPEFLRQLADSLALRRK